MDLRFPTLEHLTRINDEGPNVEKYDPAKDLETWFSRDREISKLK
jgi:hypothetical protein